MNDEEFKAAVIKLLTELVEESRRFNDEPEDLEFYSLEEVGRAISNLEPGESLRLTKAPPELDDDEEEDPEEDFIV